VGATTTSTLVLRQALALLLRFMVNVAAITSTMRVEGVKKVPNRYTTQGALVATLLRLEYETLGGVVSDLTQLRNCPKEWFWLQWQASLSSTVVVSRGQPVAVERLRSNPRMAYIKHFLSANEATKIIETVRSSGTNLAL
jgi:hypothetical protein